MTNNECCIVFISYLKNSISVFKKLYVSDCPLSRQYVYVYVYFSLSCDNLFTMRGQKGLVKIIKWGCFL